MCLAYFIAFLDSSLVCVPPGSTVQCTDYAVNREGEMGILLQGFPLRFHLIPLAGIGHAFPC